MTIYSREQARELVIYNDQLLRTHTSPIRPFPWPLFSSSSSLPSLDGEGSSPLGGGEPLPEGMTKLFGLEPGQHRHSHAGQHLFRVGVDTASMGGRERDRSVTSPGSAFTDASRNHRDGTLVDPASPWAVSVWHLHTGITYRVVSNPQVLDQPQR